MKKLIATLLLALSSTVANSEQPKIEPKFLYYKFNDAVTIVISNVPCPYQQISSEYPYSSVAYRIDGQKLGGCFKPQNQDLIEIKWNKGDVTVIPANAFLIKPVESKPEPKADM